MLEAWEAHCPGFRRLRLVGAVLVAVLACVGCATRKAESRKVHQFTSSLTCGLNAQEVDEVAAYVRGLEVGESRGKGRSYRVGRFNGTLVFMRFDEGRLVSYYISRGDGILRVKHSPTVDLCAVSGSAQVSEEGT